MRTKVTLVLLFLNVALFFFIFKFERPWRIEEKTKETRRRVLGPETANIQSIRIEGTGMQTISLAKRTDGWYLTEPLEWPANTFAVNRIVYDLQFLDHETSWPVADLAKISMSLADYGLDKPLLTVTFSTADPSTPKAPASTVTLWLGDKAKSGNLLYVLSPDRAYIHVVRRSIAESLGQGLDQLRSETLFSIPVFEVKSFNLLTAANLRIRVRREGNRWFFEAPLSQARASKTETELAINSLNALRVKSFLATPIPDSVRTATPVLRVSLEGTNRNETLLLYAMPPANAQARSPASAPADTDYYAKMEGKVEGGSQMFTVTIPAALKETLDGAQTKLRERVLFDFDPQSVTALSIAAPNQPEVSLARDSAAPAAAPASLDGPWQLVRRDGSQAPQTQPADNKTVQGVLDQLLRLSAKSFPSDAPTGEDLEKWGFNRPQRTVTLTLAGAPNSAPQTIRLDLGLGPQPGNTVYARIGGSGSVYEIDSEVLRALPVEPLAYRDRVLRQLPAGARITQLKLTDLSSMSVVLDQAIGPEMPKGAVATLVEELRTLRAKAFISTPFSSTTSVAGEERPWKFQLEATIALVGGTAGAQTSSTTLFLSERIGGTTQLAGSPDFGAVWVVEQRFLDALWEIAYGRRDPGPPASVPSPAPNP